MPSELGRAEGMGHPAMSEPTQPCMPTTSNAMPVLPTQEFGWEAQGKQDRWECVPVCVFSPHVGECRQSNVGWECSVCKSVKVEGMNAWYSTGGPTCLREKVLCSVNLTKGGKAGWKSGGKKWEGRPATKTVVPKKQM